MTPAEREYAVAYLERTRAALLEATAPLSEQLWTFKPSPGQWSACDCVEHLSISEAFLTDTIRRLCAGPAAPGDVLASCAGKETLLESKVPVRRGKAQSPESLLPTGRFGPPGKVVEVFEKTRAHTIEYARSTGDPIRERVFPHFFFGPLDGYQWLIFIAAHTERHTAQLREAIAAAAPSPGARLNSTSL